MNRFVKATGPITNPVAETVLLATGKLPASAWHFQIMLSASADAQVSLEHYAADGTTKLFDHRIYLNGNTPHNFELHWPLATNEEIKIAVKSNLTGVIGAALVAMG
jgi:hypothetical protein